MTSNTPVSDTNQPNLSRRAGGAFGLSPLQQGMLFQWLIDRNAGTDIEQIIGELHEKIDTSRFNAAWQKTVAAFDALRVQFKWEGITTPQQSVDAFANTPFAFEDLRAVGAEVAEARIAEFLEDDRKLGFDLAKAPLMRVHLFQLEDAHFKLVWSVHHILIDGRSFEVVLNAVFDAYEGRDISDAAHSYVEYIDWITQQDFAGARAFWKEKLKGFTAPTPIPADRSADETSERYGLQWTKLSRSATEDLRALAVREGLTLNTLLMSAWGLMLSRYSGEKDVVFGATKTTRRGTIENADSILGVFLATIPMRLKVDPDTSVLNYLRYVREEWVSLRGFEHLPLVDIRQASDVRAPRLFDTLFVFENYQFGTRLHEQGGAWSNRHFGILEQTGFSLTLAAYGDDELALKIQYDESRFSHAMIERMIGHLTTLLRRWCDHLALPVAAASMMTDDERQTVLYKWNETTTEYPRHSYIHELFEQQARERPDAIAVECNDESLTYRELNERADSLAVRLRAHGVSAGDRVGLFIDRSIDHVTASIAVMKAGAAFLSLEPAYPSDRLIFMIDDAELRLVLAPLSHLEQAQDCVRHTKRTPQVVEITSYEEAPAITSESTPQSADSGACAAYVMYTSGSSGTPKGVAVSHRGVVRLVCNTSYQTFTPDDVMLGMATTMFDASTWETWTALLNGGKLVLLPAGPLDIVQLNSLVREKSVTTLLYSVALFQQVVDSGLGSYESVRQFLVGGDVAPMSHLRKAMAALPNCRFVNAYGPTENAVITCAFPLSRSARNPDPLPIGPPIANTLAYVLDARGEPVATGVPGELCAGGDGVAIGYLNRPELTAERFITDQFSTEPGSRLYRTGDGARWRADGALEFLGRLDNQVKIRGYRIEPGEVENVMNALPGLRQAAVTVRKDAAGQKRLVGYYVAVGGKSFTPAEVRVALRTLLPDYMVPASLVAMEDLPQTASGKIDRNALPEPEESSRDDDELSFRTRPLGRSQMQLAQIWEQLLGRQSIGVDDDFFELGGHSLLAVRLLNEIERVLGRRLPLTTLLEKPTIRSLARQVDAAVLADAEPAMVVLNAQGKARPLIFVHGDLTGGGWYCRRLATVLGESVPLIVMPTFRPPENGDIWSIETMALKHVAELRKVQPQGPYRVGGFCAGGLIALEIARELEREGESVEVLILADSVNYNAAVSRWRPLIDRMAPPGLATRAVASRRRVLEKIRYYDLRLRAVRDMSPGQLARWAINAIRIRLPGARKTDTNRSPMNGAASPVGAQEIASPSKDSPSPHERRNLHFYAAAQNLYVPRRYGGRAELIFSSDPTDKATNAVDPEAAAEVLRLGSTEVELGWHRTLPQSRVHHIPGTHIGMIVDNLDQLGQHLRLCLEDEEVEEHLSSG